MMVMDSGYKTPAIAHLLIEDQIEPLFPYNARKRKKDYYENMSMYTMNTMIAIYMSGRKNPNVFYDKSRWPQRI